MKTGLVLEGGAMRGIYTAGVLDVFMENNIEVDGVIGVSAGAVHGASYVSKQHGRNIRYMKKYCDDWHFMSMKSLIFTGDIVGRKLTYEDIPYNLDPFDFETFLNSKIKFYAVATNLETGKANYLTCKDVENSLDVIRASASMPVVSQIVEIDGKKYLDGGTSDSIPIKAFIKNGYDRNITILTRPENYVKKPEKMMPLIWRKYKKYPKYVRCCARRHIKYNKTLEMLKEYEKEGKTLIIRPSRVINIGRVEKNPEIIQAQYDLGREDALNMLDKVKAYLN